MLPLLTVPLVNSSELSTYELKKGAIVYFNSVVGTSQKVRPDLGRIQKGKGVTTWVKTAGFRKLQKLTLSLSLVITHTRLAGVAPNH